MNDPLMAQAKAVEETAKAAGKALDIVHDMGGYLNRVFGDVPGDLVGVVGGAWLHEVAIRLRDKLRGRTEQILHDRNVQEVIEPSPNIAVALISGAQKESSEELAELWARLLANAMDPRLNNVRQSFIDAVSKMDPTDALVLENIYKRKLTGAHRNNNAVGAGAHDTDIYNLARAITRRPDDVEASLRHLSSMGFFDQRTPGNQDWFMNAISREFMRACYPEVG